MVIKLAAAWRSLQRETCTWHGALILEDIVVSSDPDASILAIGAFRVPGSAADDTVAPSIFSRKYCLRTLRSNLNKLLELLF
jgi:hypothetical protein